MNELIELKKFVKEVIAGASAQVHFFQISRGKMRDELAKLLALYSDVEESCGCASLSLSTSGGKSIVKFTLETPPPPVTTTSSRSPTSPSAPGNQAAGRRRLRNRGAAARPPATLA